MLEHATTTGALLRLFPQVYVTADRQHEDDVRFRAALAYAGRFSALSHLSALAVWQLPGGTALPVHVTTPHSVRRRSRPGVVVHRRGSFDLDVDTVLRRGLRVVRLEHSLIESWPLLPAETRRAPLIQAVSDRLTTPERVRAVLDLMPTASGRRDVIRLVNLLDAGCHSALELWGYDRVFRGPEFRDLRRQVPVRLGERTVYLDLYAERERVDIELDGERWHTGPDDRERDARRDAALAARGIMVVRFSHRRLHDEPDGVRREVLDILSSRR